MDVNIKLSVCDRKLLSLMTDKNIDHELDMLDLMISHAVNLEDSPEVKARVKRCLIASFNLGLAINIVENNNG